MKKLMSCKVNTKILEPITRPYAYVCHVINEHRLAICSFHTGECIWCRNKKPVRRYVALFSDTFFRSIYLDFGSEFYNEIKDKINNGSIPDSKTNDLFLQSYIDKLINKEISDIYVEESSKILENGIDNQVWEL